MDQENMNEGRRYVTIWIDKDIWEGFRDFCKKHGLVLGAAVEKALLKYIDDLKEKLE